MSDSINLAMWLTAGEHHKYKVAHQKGIEGMHDLDLWEKIAALRSDKDALQAALAAANAVLGEVEEDLRIMADHTNNTWLIEAMNVSRSRIAALAKEQPQKGEQ